MQKRNLTFTIYPLGEPPQQWPVECYVFGVWAVHKPHPLEGARHEWAISHAPTGVSAFECSSLMVAALAAKRLTAIEPPAVQVMEGAGDMPAVVPLSMAWIERCAQALTGLDIYCRAGVRLVRPDDIVSYARLVRSPQEIGHEQ